MLPFISATSFNRSQLQPLLPLFESMPSDLHFTVPYLLSFVMGKYVFLSIHKLYCNTNVGMFYKISHDSFNDHGHFLGAVMLLL